MQNKEVVEQLKLTLDYCMRADPDAYNEIEALKHAIKCVELIPELVEGLEITTNKLGIGCMRFENISDLFHLIYKMNMALLKKAKEMIA